MATSTRAEAGDHCRHVWRRGLGHGGVDRAHVQAWTCRTREPEQRADIEGTNICSEIGELELRLCKRLKCLARCRAKAGRFRPQNTSGWFHPGSTKGSG